MSYKIQVTVSDEANDMFNLISKETRIKKAELLEKMIFEYYTYTKNIASDNKRLLELKEYILLLIKADKNLPGRDKPDEVKKIVESHSRFERYIDEKIDKKNI